MQTLFDLMNDSNNSSQSATCAHKPADVSASARKPQVMSCNGNAPLAVRMRPRTLDEFVGQKACIGKDSWLRLAIERDILSSIILYGPPGTGKTTLAQIIAHTSSAHFVDLSALLARVKDVREELAQARSRLLTTNVKTIMFIDEIHRFSRSQQDSLLKGVENRDVILIGATTENPYFEVNSALISRSKIIELTRLSDDDIACIIKRALTDSRGLNNCFTLDERALQALIYMAAGDARAALTSLELASQVARPNASDIHAQDGSKPILITLEHVKLANPARGLPYDKQQDMHYDIISAFIKSMRGSDPDAVLYWLARMIDANEDPIFIARRILICASEDIGNADAGAICVAAAAMDAARTIGYPECRINLAQAALYCALAPKSHAAEAGIDAALAEVKKGPYREVPSYLRDRHRVGSQTYGEYLYPHNYPDGWVKQTYLPEGLHEGDFYAPSARGWEAWRDNELKRIKKNARGSHDK